ncbi:MAG TPA: DUF2199 domain-containing protein [Terriglobia bacterium]|nr:DUF2199 domain-containing protein [Terriglobia bacterium]
MTFQFRCSTCAEIHTGMPTFGAHAPLSFYEVPEGERDQRCSLGTDDCVIDEKWFFIRGCIEIPVRGETEPFVWGVWVSLSQQNFNEWISAFKLDKRSHLGPYFGWLNAWLKPYTDTANLKTRVHLRDHGIRPYIELEPTDHPLAIEQRQGITRERVAEIYSMMMHGPE